MWWLLIVGLVLALFVYYVLVKPFQFWKKKGVPQRSLWSLWVDNFKLIFQLRSQAEAIQKTYNDFGDERYGATYRSIVAVLYLRDPDLIKQITVKDFDHFVDHNQFISEELEPLWGKNLFALKGEKWRDMRATLSPSFTSSKMRAMFGLMTEVAEQFIKHFQSGGTKTVTVEFKDTFTRFANDVIASTAFGINCDSLNDRENEFYLMGKEATSFTGFWKNIKFLVILVFPKLAKLLGIHMFSKQVSAFFRKLVKANIESRERSGIIRPDMIHLLMEARKGRLKHEDHANELADTGFAVIEESSIGKEVKRQKHQLSDDDITAQALIFFFAGFESVSTLMCFTAYELGVNPDIQKRLQDEVDTTLKACAGSLTYEALMKMKYLDMVISEALRKWPTTIAVDRVCAKPYTIQPIKNGEKPVHLEKGDFIWLPMYALQRDPNYYPDPDRFDPERFSEENKYSIRPYSYIPFGAGPRSCIANRFALLETKTVFFYILANFDIVVVEKTTVPLRLAKNQFNLASENGFWFGLKPRKTT